MTKYIILFLTALLFSFLAQAQSQDFEGELRSLEREEFLVLDKKMDAVEALNVESGLDSITVNQASTKTGAPIPLDLPVQNTPESLIAPEKTRRIRSR